MYSPYTLRASARQAILESLRVPSSADCKEALRDAENALMGGALPRCLSTLEAVQFRLPSDSLVTLAIGLVRILVGDARATEPLELVAKRHDDRRALLYLILARLTFGATQHAAADLTHLLQRHSPSLSSDAIALSNRVATESGSSGWCGLSSAGSLIVGMETPSGRPIDLRVLKDGEEVSVKVVKTVRSKLHTLSTPGGWLQAESIAVASRGRDLLGSVIRVETITRMEGLVATDIDGLSGWCWFPSDPDRRPTVAAICRRDGARRLSLPVRPQRNADDTQTTFAAPWRFSAKQEQFVGMSGLTDILGPGGHALYGSPIDPMNFINSAQAMMHHVAKRYPRLLNQEESHEAEFCYEAGIPVSAAVIAPRPATCYRTPKVAVVIPVYRGFTTTMTCLKSVLTAAGVKPRVIVVVDNSPDARLVAELEGLRAGGQIELYLQSANRGFPATANIGLRQTDGEDVILLNSDTYVPSHWIERLQEAVYKSDDIGTATPMSNDASIFSYPKQNRQNKMLSDAESENVDTLASIANGGSVVDVPTAHGFCMYIRSACLDDTGVFREDLFGQGYAEENDFSRRASILGWRHVAVPGVYVGHAGSQSFSSTKSALIARNLAILNRLHLGYDRLVHDWLLADPLLPSRRRVDLLRLSVAIGGRASVLLVTHDREGGVMRHVRERASEIAARDQIPLVLVPEIAVDGTRTTRLLVATETDYPNLLFRTGETLTELKEILPELHLNRMEIHHFIGHETGLLSGLTELGIPFDVYLHDYSWFCPRITLTARANAFCGEPAVSTCRTCVAEHGSRLGEPLDPQALRERSQALFQKASSVTAPSLDAAARFRRQLNVTVRARDWEPHPSPAVPGRPRRDGKTRICVVGAIGLEKGFDCLCKCAQLVSLRHLPIEFVIVGHTCDDKSLLDTGCVTITGRYKDSEVVPLIQAQKADFAFLPAVWPETWSYVLTELWRASLPVVAYDIGAPAERIRAHGNGLLIPLQLQPEALVNLFLNPGLFPGMPEHERE